MVRLTNPNTLQCVKKKAVLLTHWSRHSVVMVKYCLCYRLCYSRPTTDVTDNNVTVVLMLHVVMSQYSVVVTCSYVTVVLMLHVAFTQRH